MGISYKNLIALREYRESDLLDMHAWVNDNKVTTYLQFALFPRTIEDTKKYLRQQLERVDNSYINFVIYRKDDLEEKYIGSIGLKNINYASRNAELNVVISTVNNTSKGYGSEAIYLICNYGFLKLGLHKIYLNVDEFNKKAINSYKKNGFLIEGLRREQRYVNGKYYNEIFMGLLADDFIKDNKIIIGVEND